MSLRRLGQLAYIPVVVLVLSATPGFADSEPWILAGESTTLYFNRHILADLGIEIVGPLHREAGLLDRLDLEVSRPSPLLHLRMPNGSFERLVAGALRHRGGFDLRWQGGYVPMQEVELYPSPDLYTFGLRGSDGSAMFVLDFPHARYLPKTRQVVFQSMDLRIAEELALRLGRSQLAGLVIGEGRVITKVVDASTTPEGIQCVANFNGEVDVQLTGLTNLSEVFHDSERVAMAPSAELANVGIADIEWYQAIAPDAYFGASVIGQHPYLAMNLYRLADGVFQQIGRSDLKHAFFAQNGGCSCDGDQVLYTGCTDLYGTMTNTWFSRLAPRSELTASTGDWVSLGSHFDGQPVDDYRDHDENDHSDPFEHRLTATVADLTTPGASYFIEAWYLAKGDVDIFNSMGYRSVSPEFDGSWEFPMTDPGLNQGSAVDAWIDPNGIPPGASTTTVDTGVGHLKLAVQTTPLADGYYHYELALMNLDFDRQVRSLAVALPDEAVVRSPGFDDVDDDAGNDWQPTLDTGSVTWATADGDPAVNALDWGTLYNFRFDTNVAPADGQLTLGVLEPGEPSALAVAAKVPAASALAMHTISLGKAGSGTVLSQPFGIDCGLDCEEDFVEGVDLRLTAVPEAGGQLAHWEESGSTLTESSLLAFEVVAERNLTAVFEACPATRALSPAVVGEEATFETCHELVAGTDFRVSGPDGDVTFSAGDRIVLGDGFVVESGAKFRAVVDPKLAAR